MVMSNKGRKGKRRKQSYDSSESNSSNDGESWMSGLHGAEQMHILASAGINPNGSDIEFEESDAKRCWKQAKKWIRNKKRR